MKSPFTGREMILSKEKRSISFRKEEFDVIFHYFKCDDTEEQFTNLHLDELNMSQLYNQYREKYSIPFQDEIFAIRKKYDLTLTKMSQILGFGSNVYRHYESGEMPSLSNAKLIQMAKDPSDFLKLVDLCDTIDGEEKRLIEKKIKEIIVRDETNAFQFEIAEYLLGKSLPDIFSGYKSPHFPKVANMVLYFCNKLEPFKTKLNKLLFYSDFMMFRECGYSISGLRYQAIQKGPVPINFQSLYDFLKNEKYITVDTVDFGEYYGEKIKCLAEFDEKLFSEKELDVFARVAQKFEYTNATRISDMSHLEKAWKENFENKNLIDYNFAFDLQTV